MAEPESASASPTALDLTENQQLEQLINQYRKSSSQLQRRFLSFKAQTLKNRFPHLILPDDLQDLNKKIQNNTLDFESCLSPSAQEMLNLESADFPPLKLPTGLSLFKSPLEFDWKALSTILDFSTLILNSP